MVLRRRLPTTHPASKYIRRNRPRRLLRAREPAKPTLRRWLPGPVARHPNLSLRPSRRRRLRRQGNSSPRRHSRRASSNGRIPHHAGEIDRRRRPAEVLRCLLRAIRQYAPPPPTPPRPKTNPAPQTSGRTATSSACTQQPAKSSSTAAPTACSTRPASASDPVRSTTC